MQQNRDFQYCFSCPLPLLSDRPRNMFQIVLNVPHKTFIRIKPYVPEELPVHFNFAYPLLTEKLCLFGRKKWKSLEEENVFTRFPTELGLENKTWKLFRERKKEEESEQNIFMSNKLLISFVVRLNFSGLTSWSNLISLKEMRLTELF